MVDLSGYDAEFLGTPVPLPSLAPPTVSTRLDYPHFSVHLVTQRRLAGVTGVNIDGAALVNVPRQGSWHLDLRVPASEQAGGEIYTRNDLDRGHLVRRRDPGWGADAMAATEATFAYTNAAPQAAAFNQSPQLWLGLEDHVLHHAEAQDQRLSVFTAPVLASDDPPYRGIRIPRRFWKIAAWATAERQLAATAFVLDQTELIADTGDQRSVAPLPPFSTFQVPVADVAALARVELGPLVAADVLSTGSARDDRWRRLRDLDQIRLG